MVPEPAQKPATLTTVDSAKSVQPVASHCCVMKNYGHEVRGIIHIDYAG